MAFDPFASFAAGVKTRNDLNQQDANRQAAQGLVSGNYAQALGALAGAGDFTNVVKVQEAQAAAQKTAQEQQKQQQAQQLQTTQQIIRTVKSARDSGQDVSQVLPTYRNAFIAMGADPQQLAQIEQQVAANPAFLDQIENIIGQQARQLEIQNLGNGYGVAIDKATGQVVNEYQAPQRPMNVGNVLIDPGTGQVILDAREPKYQTIQNTDGSTSVVAIDQPAPRGGATGGGSGVPRGIRNNNPGNIEDGAFARSLPGYRGSDGRFAIFDSPQAGINAGGELLNRYAARGVVTPAQIINRWAPPSDGNPTQAYAQYVASRLGIGVNDPVPANRRAEAFQAINEFENGNRSASNGAPAAVAGGGMRVIAQGENRGLTPAQQLAESRAQATENRDIRNTARQLRTEFEAKPDIKNFRDVEASYRQVRQLAASGSATDDVGLIFSFMKMLDPGSVVREGEYALVGRAQGLTGRALLALQRIDSGQSLTPELRREVAQTANQVYQSRLQRYTELENQYRTYAQEDGIDPNRVVSPRETQRTNRPQTNAPGIPFNLAGPQLATRQRLVQQGATSRAAVGSTQNPRYVNPQQERQSLMNIRPGEWFVTPSGEMLRMPNPNPYRRR